MPQIYMIEINITCVPLYFRGCRLNFTELVGACRLTKAVPDASSPCFKCPTYGAGEPSVALLSILAEKRHVKKQREEKETPPRRNDSRYRRDGEANKVSAISKRK